MTIIYNECDDLCADDLGVEARTRIVLYFPDPTIGQSYVSLCLWIVPGTCSDDPEYWRSEAQSNYLRSHRPAYWFAQYPVGAKSFG